jgi:hypothetical protein
LLERLDLLDKKGESTPLSTVEKELQVTLHDRLKKLLREEEIKCRQRAKEKDLKEGDVNTRYFHLKASGRRKKNYILVLQNNGEEIYGESDLIKHVTDFYKQLFGPSTVSSLNLNGIDCKQLTEEDRHELTKPFDLEEIKRVVFEMKHNKAAGPDGFPAEFYQLFWDTIKEDLKETFDKFHDENLDIERLNHGVITLVLKVPDALTIQKFRPICLLNVSYKILTKLLADRLGLVIHKIIADTQTAFIRNRYIMEGIVILHEIIHELHHRKTSGFLFKINFEKAYDKVNWDFLYQMMQARGIGDVLHDWIMKVVRGGRCAVKVNDTIGPYFPTYAGVRQGDPLSPILFDIVGDGLAIIIKKAQTEGLVKGLVPHLVDGGVWILQYADDTILLLDDDLDNARNIKFILCLFEQISGLKINFHKSEIFCLGELSRKPNTIVRSSLVLWQNYL